MGRGGAGARPGGRGERERREGERSEERGRETRRKGERKGERKREEERKRGRKERGTRKKRTSKGKEDGPRGPGRPPSHPPRASPSPLVPGPSLSRTLTSDLHTNTHTHTRSLFSRRGRTGAAGGARRSPGGRQPTGAADRLGRGAWSGPPCVGVCKDTGLLLLSYRPVTTQLHNQYILARHAHAQAAAPVRSRAPRACPPASAADARGLPACQRRTPVRPWRWQYFERAPARFPNRHTSPPAPPPPPLPCRQPPTRRA